MSWRMLAVDRWCQPMEGAPNELAKTLLQDRDNA
jgi:hypothetical protein